MRAKYKEWKTVKYLFMRTGDWRFCWNGIQKLEGCHLRPIWGSESARQNSLLALPTLPGEDGSADLQYILKVAADLSEMIEDYKVIVDKSTVPAGTAEKSRSHPGVEVVVRDKYDVVSNPEFLREGVAVEDFETRSGGYRCQLAKSGRDHDEVVWTLCATG